MEELHCRLEESRTCFHAPVILLDFGTVSTTDVNWVSTKHLVSNDGKMFNQL